MLFRSSIFGDSIGSDDFGGLNDISGSSTMLLDGEYALVEDAASGEYVYLNFKRLTVFITS